MLVWRWDVSQTLVRTVKRKVRHAGNAGANLRGCARPDHGCDDKSNSTGLLHAPRLRILIRKSTWSTVTLPYIPSRPALWRVMRHSLEDTCGVEKVTQRLP